MSGQIVNEGSWVKVKSAKTAELDTGTLADRKEQIYIEKIMSSLGGKEGEPVLARGSTRLRQVLVFVIGP